MSAIISYTDFRVLKETIIRQQYNLTFFKKIMQKIVVVRDELIPKTTVKLNSIVLLWHSLLKKTVKFRIVSPDHVDLSLRNVSVFAPIASAIMGHKEKDLVRVSIGGIEKELKIIIRRLRNLFLLQILMI